MHYKKNLIPLLCLIVIVFINACKKSSSGGDTGTLSVSRAAIDLDTTGGFTDTLTIHSTLSWKATLSTGASWCKLRMANSDAGDAVLTITILSNNGTATAQTATITFTATNGQASPVTVSLTQKAFPISSQLLGGSKWEFAYDVKKTTDGGMIIVDSAQSPDGDLTSNQGAEDIMVAKLDASGNKQWVKTFGGSASDYANAVTPTTDGGYIFAGWNYK